MTTLCLTGWQQPADALSCIAPDTATHIDYSHHNNVEALLTTLPRSPRVAIGWSLGGQILVRAVAGGYVRPQTVILLGASFQFLSDANFTQGMPASEYPSIIAGYANAPTEMLTGFNALVGAGDQHSASIARTLNQNIIVWPQGKFWLEELGRFSCSTLNFADFPRTIIIHGLNDKVASVGQAKAFATHIASSELQLLENCAHAPHMHDTAALKALVERYV